ncbi:MAG: 3-ketoacyl-ACP reductase [Lentisphaerae bacterium]|nr:3-ketoacyl-ACP reductase [Lentisphaerota bacterium]
MKRVALVTGGGRGIGFGVAERLARDGFDIAFSGVRAPELVQEAVAALRAHGSEVLYCQADVSEASARQRLVDAVREHFGRLHVLVNNAGIAPPVRADILDAGEESYDIVMRTNLKGPYFLTQAVARWLVDQKRQDAAFQGCIINVSSVSATVASVNRGEYCLSKAGVSMATQLWAARLGEFDLPVYEVRPGVIKTDMTAGVTSKYDKLIAQGLLVQSRWGSPEDVGKAVAMLARGDMPYSTGQVILVDGGLTLPRL